MTEPNFADRDGWIWMDGELVPWREAIGLRAQGLSVYLSIACWPWPDYLAGITRDTVFSLAAEQSLTIHERHITRDEVYIADEAFFTGTAAEVLPIQSLDTCIIGSGARGPITEQLQSAYFEQVRGQRDTFPDLHTPVQ